MNAGVTKYTDAFFSEARRERTRLSAETVVPWLLHTIQPQSVVDVGCGTGTWLSVFHQLGVADILGIDGSWVETAQLEIPSRLFCPADLNRGFPVTRRFDLAISLEVAEHIPPHAAEAFIRGLVGLSPVIFFSAAIPQQGGTGHLNEQWPSYWQDLFIQQGYVCVDCFRNAFWNEERVAPWYIQNSFFYIRKSSEQSYQGLFHLASMHGLTGEAVVHPRIYEARIAEISEFHIYTIANIARKLMLLSVKRSLRKVGKLFGRIFSWLESS